MSKNNEKNIEKAAKRPYHDSKENRQKPWREPPDAKNAAWATDSRTQYDECAKRLLGNKEILSHILVGCVDDFMGMNPKDVEKLIEGEPYIGIVPIEPGLTNAAMPDSTDENPSTDKPTRGKRIIGMNTESSEVNEGLVKFDIVFYVRLPGGASKIIINVEAQKSVGSSPILNRAIYYACRQISAQKDREFTGMDYKDIKRVYSIWICMNQPEDSITRYRLEKNDLFGSAEWKGDPALLNIVMVGITSTPHEREEGYELNRLLSTLLSMEMPPEERLEILRNEYNIAKDEERDEEVNAMCNLSEDIWEKGMEKGIEKGIEQGRDMNRIEMILKMHDNNLSIEQISLIAEKSVDEVRAIIQEREPARA